MRPSTHRNQEFAKRCGNCKHCHVVEFKDDSLCFYGDNAKIIPSDLRDYWSEVELDGLDVGIMEGEEYSEVWAGRVVSDWCDVCDSWEPAKTPGA